MNMETRLRCVVAILGLLTLAPGLRAADFELTPAELEQLNRGETVIRASLDAGQRRGTVRAAMFVDAPPAVVFQAMTRCEEALKFVPHLRSCRSLPQADDPGMRLVEHEVDFGWYAPRVRYTFRADVVPDRSITFRQVAGDFKAHEGVWEFEPAGEGTLLRYRVRIDPPGYVPTWLARSTFKQDLPRMLANLKQHCEAAQVLRAQANTIPY